MHSAWMPCPSRVMVTRTCEELLLSGPLASLKSRDARHCPDSNFVLWPPTSLLGKVVLSRQTGNRASAPSPSTLGRTVFDAAPSESASRAKLRASHLVPRRASVQNSVGSEKQDHSTKSTLVATPGTLGDYLLVL